MEEDYVLATCCYLSLGSGKPAITCAKHCSTYHAGALKECRAVSLVQERISTGILREATLLILAPKSNYVISPPKKMQS